MFVMLSTLCEKVTSMFGVVKIIYFLKNYFYIILLYHLFYFSSLYIVICVIFFLYFVVEVAHLIRSMHKLQRLACATVGLPLLRHINTMATTSANKITSATATNH